MRIRHCILVTFFLFPVFLLAQQSESIKGSFYNKENKVRIYLDLSGENLIVPGYEFLGKTKGYMCGDIYGMWLLTSSKIDNGKAVLRFSNDSGSDSQSILFTQQSDSVFLYEALDGNVVKKAVKRKLVKIPSKMLFNKQ